MSNRTIIPKGTHIRIGSLKKRDTVKESCYLLVFRLAKDAVLVDGVQLDSSRVPGKIVENPNGWRSPTINHIIRLEHDEIVPFTNSQAVKFAKLDTTF